MSIIELKQVIAHEADARLRDERGDWSQFYTDNIEDKLRNWLFDRMPREDGQYCYEVRMNGLKGFLFASYNECDGIAGIEFVHRNHRWHRRAL